MAEVGQDRQPIQITTVSEKLHSRTPERGGGYLEIVE